MKGSSLLCHLSRSITETACVKGVTSICQRTFFDGWTFLHRRVQTIACQALMILFPLGTSGWMAYICYLFVNPEPGLPFTDTQLNAFATPPLLQE